MTDTKISLNYDTIEQLFKNGVCLTYDPLEPTNAWLYAKQLVEEYRKEHNVERVRICSATAKIRQGRYNTDFHYFSDGTLIHCCEVYSKNEKQKIKSEEELQRIYTLLKIRGFTVKRVYGPQEAIDFFHYSDMLRYISERAMQIYSYIDDLYVEALPDKQSFVEECFAGDNILLTASKDVDFPPECREFAALFADGSFFVSEDYTNRRGVKNTGKLDNFKHDYLWQNPPYCASQSVPQEYIDALYEKAEEFSWYAAPEEKRSKSMSVDELIKMNKYIDDLFKGRTCLTVVNPAPNSAVLSPNFESYALFSDGLLVSVSDGEDDKPFVKSLKKCFPDLTFRFEKVSKEYIAQIYRRLPEFQKGATAIYIEMLKQKARKLKRITALTHLEALDAVAKMAGWQDWRAIKVEDEMQARQLIDAEKERRGISGYKDKSLLAEYNNYLKHHK